ncbi:MAG: PfkB family carbohydrate kinase [Pyrinomonadaceae bacterium]
MKKFVNYELNNSAPLLCFGEVLWDRFPGSMLPGGAPVNVAYHLKRHGRHAIPITAVGEDELGVKLLQQIKDWELDARFISIVKNKPTGVVDVILHEDGSASYRIAEEVAWDFIETPSEVLETARRCAALIFGTLAARFDHNREKLALLLLASEASLKVYDVNLRPPYDQHHLVWELARRADLVKLNDAELLALVAARRAGRDDLQEAAAEFASQSNCPFVCVTAGARGAGLLADGVWHWADAHPVIARDTVGAGDAFLASLIDGMLRRESEEEFPKLLARACRVGEFVAASDGATPLYHLSNGQVVTPQLASEEAAAKH